MTLDLGKIPFEKAFYQLAKILPGFAIVGIYDLRFPGSISWYFSIGFLGYATKLSLLLSACFLVGYSASSLAATALGAAGGAFGALWGNWTYGRHPYDDEVAPWRNDAWRAAFKTRYGASAPADTKLIPRSILELLQNRVSEIDADPTGEGRQLERLFGDFHQQLIEAVTAITNDQAWKFQYQKLHAKAVLERKMEVIEEVTEGLDSNLAISASIVLVSAIFVNQARIPWLLFLSGGWLVISVLRTSSKIQRLLDPWTTLQEQIDSLASTE